MVRGRSYEKFSNVHCRFHDTKISRFRVFSATTANHSHCAVIESLLTLLGNHLTLQVYFIPNFEITFLIRKQQTVLMANIPADENVWSQLSHSSFIATDMVCMCFRYRCSFSQNCSRKHDEIEYRDGAMDGTCDIQSSKDGMLILPGRRCFTSFCRWK